MILGNFYWKSVKLAIEIKALIHNCVSRDFIGIYNIGIVYRDLVDFAE